jgi:hypothetical protein
MNVNDDTESKEDEKTSHDNTTARIELNPR